MRASFLFTCLMAAACLLPQGAGAQISRSGGQLRKSADREVLVKFREIGSARLSALSRAHDLDRSHRLGGVGRLYRFRSRSRSTEELVQEFKSRPDVLYAEPNYVVRAVEQPNDPRFAEQWSLHNTGQAYGFPAGTPGADIGAFQAWELTTGTPDHVVAVIDTGIDYAHPDLQPNVWTAPAAFTVNLAGSSVTCPAGSHGFNAITLACDPMDDNRHGTHVAGTIGAVGGNSLGVVGINWTTRLMGIKFLDASGSGYISDAVNAIEFVIQAKQIFSAAADVRVLSNSWGGGGFSQALLDEIKRAGDADMLFVAAAGNNGYDNDRTAFYPASYNAPNLIAVAATDNNDALASFSNFGGASVQLGAPGVNILSTIPGGQYAYLSGTSMAAPHVSGAAALVLSRCPLSTPDLKASLVEQVDLLPGLNSITASGGRLDVNNSLRDCTAPVSLSPGSLAFARQVVDTASAPRTVALINRQATPLGLSSIVAGGDFSQTNDCGQSLAIHARCTITVTFTPSALGYATGALTITHDAANSPQTVPLSGYGILAATVAPQQINFAGVVLGSSSTAAYLTLTNNQAGTPLAIGGITVTGAFSQTNNCGASVAPSQSCAVLVTFTPVALGSQQGALTISDSAPNSPHTVPLTGTGVSRVSLSPGAIDFGGVPVGQTSLARSSGLRNSQKAGDILITSIVASGDFTQSNNCGSGIAPGLTCTINVNFRPTAMGPRSGAVLISDNTPESPHVLALAGTGLGLPDLVENSVSALGALIAGKSAQVSDIAANQGAGAAGASVTRYYLSSIRSSTPTGTLLSGTRSVPALGAGATSAGTATITLSAYFIPGSYYLLACADDTRAVVESNESNNCVSASSMLAIGGADLLESSVSVNGRLIVGRSVLVTDTAMNQGRGDAASSTTRYYLSSTASSVPSGTLLTGSRAVPALAAGSSSAGTVTVTLSPYTPAGSYYLLACADATRSVAEENENNNCRATSLLPVSAQ